MSAIPSSNTPPLPPSVARLFQRVRLRIRRDSLADGLLLLVCSLACTFWATLLLDEAWFGLQKLELPVGLRAVLLTALVPAALWLILRRVCFPLLRKIRDLDVALLLERHFPLFQDRLVTAVEACGGLPADSSLSRQMLQRSLGEAAQLAGDVQPEAIFDTTLLKRQSLAAGGLFCSIAVAAVIQPDLVPRWFNAFIRCAPEYHQRSTAIEAFVIAQPGDRRLPFTAPSPSAPAVCRHPIGADLELEFIVPDGGPMPGVSWVIPDRLRVDVIRTDGTRSRSWLTPTARGRFRFVVTQLREPIDVEVLGGDFRSRLPWHVDVVNNPSLDEIELECTFPDYTGWNEQRERRLQVTGSDVQLPEGTQFLLRARSAKPLQSVRVLTDQFEFTGDEASGKVIGRNGGPAIDLPQPLVAADGRTVELQLSIAPAAPSTGTPETSAGGDSAESRSAPAALTLPPSGVLSVSSNTTLRFFLHDRDDIISASPETLRLTGTPDKPPVVVAQMSGIGNSVTRRARIPLAIRIRDDYGIRSAGFEFQVDDETNWRPRPFRRFPDAGVLEYSAESAEYFELQPLELTEGQSLTLSVAATDSNPITGGSLSRSTPLPFRIVSDDELLSLLYTREIALRSRFEELIARLEEVRKDLQFHSAAADRADTAGASASRDDLAAIDSCGSRSVNSLRRQANELNALIEAFEEILQQLVNNAIPLHNAEAMQAGIVDPLRRIRDTGMPAADRAVAAIRAAALVSQPLLPPIRQAETVLTELISTMQGILESVRDLAEFHEAVRDLQQLSEEQKKVLEETKRLQKNQLFDDLLK
ncbi:MAG: hypothetical protein RLZZ436_3511 [Planctomycetota bacterium]|jgi:hypothetical protein